MKCLDRKMLYKKRHLPLFRKQSQPTPEQGQQSKRPTKRSAFSSIPASLLTLLLILR